MIKALPYISNSKLPLLENIVIDNTSLFFTLVIPLGLNFIFSALALYSVNKEVIAINLSGSGKGSATQSNHWLSKSLMVLQLALASILLTGSVMLALQSYHAVYQDMGYHLGNSYEIQINGRDKSWQQKVNKDITYQGSELQSIHQQLTKTVETQITNSKVIINSFGPLANIFMTRSFINNDHPQPVIFQERYLSKDYFKAFKIPFIAGSNLSTEQIKSNDNSVIIDQTMAKVMFPKLSYSEIIGKEIGISEIPSKVNGIVKNTIFTAGDTSPIVLPSVYVADIRQHTFITLTVILPDGKNLSASMIAPAIKKAFPQLGDVKVTSLQARKLEQTLSERISLWIIITITVLTLFLAAIGISGLTQMTTNQRQYELAIRMATGASQSRLVNFILKDALWMLFIGLGVGFIAAVWLYQQVKTQLTILPNFSWQASTILDISLVIIVLLSVLIPAWRVIRTDPMQALREE